jgi:hypothetical protein
MGMLEEAQLWLEQQRHLNMTVPVAYQRGGGETIEMQATLGKSTFKSEDDYGRLIRTVSTDFLIRVQDLVIDDENVIPQAGDYIFYPRASETNSKVGVYEVTAINGQPPWRYSDVNNKTFRVHTKASE